MVNRNRASEEAFNENIKSSDDLKRRAAGNLTEIEEFDLKHEVEASNNDFQVNQKIEDGNRLNYEEKLDEALEKYGEALKIKLVDGVGEYRMLKDIDDLEDSKERSKLLAIKDAQRKIGLVFSDYSRNLDFELTADIINTMPVVKIVDINRQIVPSEDDSELIIRTNVRMKYNSDDIEQMFVALKKKIAERRT